MLFYGASAAKPMNINDLTSNTVRVKPSLNPRLRDVIDQLESIFGENQESRRSD